MDEPVELDRVMPFEHQMMLQGYDLAGQLAEFSALIAEQPGWDEMPNGYPLWDRGEDWLDNLRVSAGAGAGYEPAPAWWALPNVSEGLAISRTYLRNRFTTFPR